ncbi:MAG: DnaJ domain-containing protein [Deltaproteobacteria bacterium]|nr:DnaJ domain-containing protein [Deltaproteobacteria bacterium]
MIVKIILVILGLTYAASPFDLVPDFLIGLGWIDDIAVIFLLWKAYKYYMRRKYAYSREYTQSSSNSHSDYRQQTENVSHTTDPYEVLGVGKKASQDQIRSAYKSLAAKYHPDKVSHLGEEFKELAEQRFKEIQEAYQKLKVKG